MESRQKACFTVTRNEVRNLLHVTLHSILNLDRVYQQALKFHTLNTDLGYRKITTIFTDLGVKNDTLFTYLT